MAKIQMKTPLVELDGDEMTRILWKEIKEKLLAPYIDLKTEYYDLGLEAREKTKDQVTVDAANAIAKYGVGVKCATITPNAQRVEEYHLSQMWKSPNGTLRAILDGTVFRTPIVVNNIHPLVRSWKRPITIARHAYGDIYKATEYRVPEEGKAELVFTNAQGRETFRETVYEFECPGVLQGSYNKDSSIFSFAHACFQYALNLKQDLWFSAKDTISKQYDHRFKDIFEELYETVYREQFEAAGIQYKYMLIDSAVAALMKCPGGILWACKNYDGDVMSDMVSSAFGSLAMMTSVLVSPDGKYEYEAAHGTVQDQYYMHLRGEKTSTNPIATIFAWSGALRRRGELDELPELCAFADNLERACLDTVESGIMTGDLAPLCDTPVEAVDTDTFMEAIRAQLDAKMQSK